MGQCQNLTTSSELRDNEYEYEEQTPTNASLHAPKDAKILKKFPDLPKAIKTIEKQLGQFCPQNETVLKVYELANKSIYEGQWKVKMEQAQSSKMRGLGKLLNSDGTFIQSDFINNNVNGKTRIIRPSGDYFDGKINYDGSGVGIVFQNGIKYSGKLLHNKPHGKGKEVAPNFTFEGQYENGNKKNGLLKWTSDKKQRFQYNGNFKDDLFSGQGILRDNEGQYDGEFQVGRKDGKGILKYKNGDIYDGQFSRNLREGYGKLTQFKGTIKEGIWSKNKLVEIDLKQSLPVKVKQKL